MAENKINSIDAIDCAFCRRVELERFAIRETNKYCKKHELEPILYEMAVAFVSHTWTKTKGKKRAGRTIDYRHLGLGYKLNYCPECGKRLRGKTK